MTIPEIQKLLEQGCQDWSMGDDEQIRLNLTVICKPCAAAAILELERVQNSVADTINYIDKALGIK